ncbi:toxin-antitoxin system HicB family antitoxin [Saccharopolyspora erythraea]|uniref:toxin-antitoxin system HicB family antitoxin n=1 Tax=Saccharopolyspora erythraea TaxID=1836 RepID=UPI001BAE4BA1|nr:toxin-antitoxin system HicB family antitoxin [Saccharopolyspora erythraea]QUH00932.1 toxin-antitoxin system HicB family antitoxin [Saccharopolyspora erythraea]
MDLSPYISQLREDLTSAASAGDEQTRQTAAVLSSAIEPAARLAIMNALSDLAAEVTTHLDGQVVDIRLDGRDVRVGVSGSTGEPAGARDEQPPPPPPGDGGDISRITLRLLDEIKSQAEQAASVQGVSLNTWVAQAVQGALHGGARARGPREGGHGGRPWGPPGAGRDRWRGDGPGGSRVHGWVQG